MRQSEGKRATRFTARLMAAAVTTFGRIPGQQSIDLPVAYRFRAIPAPSIEVGNSRIRSINLARLHNDNRIRPQSVPNPKGGDGKQIA